MPRLLATAGLLLIAGHETTVNLITNGMLTLLRHPDVLERLRREPELVSRWSRSCCATSRRCSSAPAPPSPTSSIAGVTIPKGSSIVLCSPPATATRAASPTPTGSIPDREDNEHLGFGGGIHYCFGAPLARVEAQIALGELARRLENPRLVVDPPPYRENPVLRGPRHLLVDVDGIR